MITDFEQYRIISEAVDNLSDDITIYGKDDPDKRIDPNVWEIDRIVDVITDPDEIEKYESQNVSMDLTVKTVKPGDVLWLTALLKPRNNSAAHNIGEMGVIQVKVMQTFYGLNKLKQVKAQGRL
jgi:hypothetical protein